MADLLALSSRIIDEGVAPGPVNRITHELSEIAPGVAMVEAFSHSVLFATDDGLVVFDTSGAQGGKLVVDAIRGWSKARFNTLVYTHGHIDHVGGCGAFLADAAANGAPRPTIAGHENVPRRFDRYDLTNGYNLVINARQFRGLSGRGYGIGGESGRFLPARQREAERHVQRPARTQRRRSRIRSAPRERRNRRPHLGVDSAVQSDLRRRLLHLEFSERRQSAEGAALSGGVGRGDAHDGRRRRRAVSAGARTADCGRRAHQTRVARSGRDAREADRRNARDDERRRAAERHHPHRESGAGDAAASVSATAVRRTGVRRAQPVAHVRRLVRRQSGESEAGAGQSARGRTRRRWRAARKSSRSARINSPPTANCGSRVTSSNSPCAPNRGPPSTRSAPRSIRSAATARRR